MEREALDDEGVKQNAIDIFVSSLSLSLSETLSLSLSGSTLVSAFNVLCEILCCVVLCFSPTFWSRGERGGDVSKERRVFSI